MDRRLFLQHLNNRQKDIIDQIKEARDMSQGERDYEKETGRFGQPKPSDRPAPGEDEGGVNRTVYAAKHPEHDHYVYKQLPGRNAVKGSNGKPIKFSRLPRGAKMGDKITFEKHLNHIKDKLKVEEQTGLLENEKKEFSLYDLDPNHRKIVTKSHRRMVAAAGVSGIRDMDELTDKQKTDSYNKYKRHATEFKHEPISSENYFASLKKAFA